MKSKSSARTNIDPWIKRDPKDWESVKNYLEAAGASKRQADETREYVEKVLEYENDFTKKSPANSKSKFDEARINPKGAHWVTIGGRHILIKDKT